MLVRTACKAGAAPLVARAGTLSVARHNSTVAPASVQTEQTQEAQSTAPVRKSRIPLTQAYGDLAIPDRDSATQFARNRGSVLGTHRLSQDQFAGRGDLADRLLKKRAAQVQRENPRRTGGQNNKPGYVKSAAHAQPNDAKPAEKAITEAREKSKRARRGEPTILEALPNKTNLAELFNASTPTSQQVVPLSLATPKGKKLATDRAQLTLERTAGDYSRYLSPTLASRPGETMKRLGPVGYAELALARVRLATPKQRQNGLAIVSRLTGSGPGASQSVSAS